MNHFLTMDNLYRKAPSIFTQSSAEGTSAKYQHISTLELVEKLMAEGFKPTSARQSNSRLESKKSFAKHCIRFRHVDTKPSASQLFPELVLVNSHDGLSSYRLYAGLYRLVCSNGLVAGEEYEDVKVRHQGDVVGNVIEGTYSIIDTARQLINVTDKMSSVILDKNEQLILAEAAHSLRFEDSETGLSIEPKKLLSPRRSSEVNKDDLFTVFNIVQENVIKGGVRGYGRDNQGYSKRIRSREIKSIDQDTSLNRALWTLTERMMQLKGVQ